LLENNPFKVYQWLREHITDPETAEQSAVFFKAEWLIQDDFRLAKQIMAHPRLRRVPLIVLADGACPVSTETLIAHGIDDCYESPVEWSALVARLEFLMQFKQKIQATFKTTVRDDFKFKITPIKRALDIIGAVIGILLTAPLWIPTVIAIRLESPGPILYRSKRAGRGYHLFDFWKFRSMYQDADQRLQEYLHLNQYEGARSVFVKFAHDPRITRVGRFIRKYSIDELPQLLNVLRGDMSLVGNRPLPQYEASLLTVDEWSTRFMAPAGITGLWQVTKRGHSHMSVEDRINLDIVYAQSHTDVWADLRIMRRTFGAFIQHENV
jgi:lipopolysaccharide/colanic/teichoic acid biosynthesis glycosyltransferase